jgi:hypothetical protein
MVEILGGLVEPIRALYGKNMKEKRRFRLMVNSPKGDFPDAWLTPAMVPLDKMEHFVDSQKSQPAVCRGSGHF